MSVPSGFAYVNDRSVVNPSTTADRAGSKLDGRVADAGKPDAGKPAMDPGGTAGANPPTPADDADGSTLPAPGPELGGAPGNNAAGTPGTLAAAEPDPDEPDPDAATAGTIPTPTAIAATTKTHSSRRTGPAICTPATNPDHKG